MFVENSNILIKSEINRKTNPSSHCIDCSFNMLNANYDYCRRNRGIYCYQSKYNYLKNQTLFQAMLLCFSNLHYILNIFKMSLITSSLKLLNAKIVLT